MIYKVVLFIVNEYLYWCIDFASGSSWIQLNEMDQNYDTIFLFALLFGMCFE